MIVFMTRGTKSVLETRTPPNLNCFLHKDTGSKIEQSSIFWDRPRILALKLVTFR